MSLRLLREEEEEAEAAVGTVSAWPSEGVVRAYLGGSPRPSHLLGLHDVSQVPIREDPTAEREAQIPTIPDWAGGPLLPSPAGTHCSPRQVEMAAKECGLPRSFPW